MSPNPRGPSAHGGGRGYHEHWGSLHRREVSARRRREQALVSGEKLQRWNGTHPKCTLGSRLPEHRRSLPASYLLTHSLSNHQT